MFPQNGENVPRVRFKGFTGAWVKREINTICEQLSKVINPQDNVDSYFSEYSMPAFDNGAMAEIVLGASMNSARKIIDKPCLLVNKLNVRKKRIWIVECPEDNAVCSAEFVPLHPIKDDLKFLKYTLMGDKFTKYLEDCSSGSSNSQKRVTPDIIMSYVIDIPCIEEQRTIGIYLQNLDNLINHYQRKNEEIEQLKQAMIRLIFI